MLEKREKLPEIYTIVRRVKIQYTVKQLPVHLPPIYPTYPDLEDEGSDCSDYEDWNWDDDEFEELSDLEGDEDSVLDSQVPSSVSWASLVQDEVSESVTTTDSGLGSEADITVTKAPVTQSLFRHCPPVLYFPNDNEKLTKLPRAIRKQLKWKMSTITPNVVKNIIARAGFETSTKKRDWIGYWGKHMKATAFRNILPHQKVNHFPGTFEIGRKDKLWKNLYRCQVKFSKKEYDFIPQTYCLPNEWKTFKRMWDEGGNKCKWIIKPPASARGIGIKVVHKLNQIPRKKSIIVQKYLANPYLINGRKFDLRLYVYVTSYDPLIIYVYDNGLVRFATSKYSHSSKSLSNRYAHLTNYSVNKNNDAYIKNVDAEGTNSHKWAIKSLWQYLEAQGHDLTNVKAKIQQIIIKAIIASVPTVSSLSKSNCKHRHTCHELFGFDIFLDSHLKPWLIEVNISPSLHTNSSLDKSIKYGLVKDLFNTAGYLVPEPSGGAKSSLAATVATPGSVTPSSKTSLLNEDYLMYFNPGLHLSSDEKSKHAFYSQRIGDTHIQETILDRMTPDDIRVLMKFEDEKRRRGDLELIFPTADTVKYMKYFPSVKFYDLLLQQWIKKWVKDPQKGITKLQKLAETEIQFSQEASCADHVWSKAGHRFGSKSSTASKSSDVGGTKGRRRSSLGVSPRDSIIQLEIQLSERKIHPVTYKPPLPSPIRRPMIDCISISRSASKQGSRDAKKVSTVRKSFGSTSSLVR